MMGPDPEIPVFPALDLHLHRTEARAGPPVSWELKPRDIVNTKKLMKAFVYMIASYFLISSIPMENQHLTFSANYLCIDQQSWGGHRDPLIQSC